MLRVEFIVNACFGDIDFSEKINKGVKQSTGEELSFSHPVVNCTFFFNASTAMLAWGSTLGKSKSGVACFGLAPNGMVHVYPYLLKELSHEYFELF